jgi:predicted regulator of Ras-like GTPase activity (Roadblock/LC7/MglB family)
MKTPAPADLQRWSDEVARDPRSLAFLPLARAYRRQGLRDEALRLCLRGLESYPTHVEAHGLLALLYLEAGDSTRAADEWSMVLRADPDNFDALRGLGFCFLEQDRLSRARQMLERAALQRPGDAAVQEALRLLGTRQELVEQTTARRRDAIVRDDPWAEYVFAPADEPMEPADAPPAMGAPTGAAASGAASPASPARDIQAQAGVIPGGHGRHGVPAGAAGAATTGRFEFDDLPADPTLLFDALLTSGPLLGALLIDGQGMVLAGRMTEAVTGDGATLGAVLGGAIGEATRTAAHLALGAWRGILLESEHALLHLAPAGADAVVVLAARRSTPAGWMVRASAQSAQRAVRYLESYA